MAIKVICSDLIDTRHYCCIKKLYSKALSTHLLDSSSLRLLKGPSLYLRKYLYIQTSVLRSPSMVYPFRDRYRHRAKHDYMPQSASVPLVCSAALPIEILHQSSRHVCIEISHVDPRVVDIPFFGTSGQFTRIVERDVITFYNAARNIDYSITVIELLSITL